MLEDKLYSQYGWQSDLKTFTNTEVRKVREELNQNTRSGLSMPHLACSNNRKQSGINIEK